METSLPVEHKRSWSGRILTVLALSLAFSFVGLYSALPVNAVTIQFVTNYPSGNYNWVRSAYYSGVDGGEVKVDDVGSDGWISLRARGKTVTRTAATVGSVTAPYGGWVSWGAYPGTQQAANSVGWYYPGTPPFNYPTSGKIIY